MKFVDLLAESSYVPKRDRDLPEEEQTKIILRGLDYTAQKQIEGDLAGGKARMPMNSVGKKKADIPDDAMMEVDLNARGMEIELRVLRRCFVGIEGPSAPPEEFPTDEGKKNNWFIQWFDRRLRTEIANYLIEQGEFSEDETKN